MVALATLASLALLWLGRDVARPLSNASRIFEAVAYPVLILVMLWVVWALQIKRSVSARATRVLLTVFTVYYVIEMSVGHLTYEGDLYPRVYEAQYWKVLVLAVTWVLVSKFRTGLVVSVSLTGLTVAVQLLSLYSASKGGAVYPPFAAVLSSQLKLIGAVGLVMMLSFTKEQWRHSDREMQRMRHLAHTDPLTDAWNRRRLNDAYREAIEEGRVPLTVILFDIDSFKEINDTFGHDAGDRALVATANLVQTVLRKGDSFGRWGGEEFLVLCPSTSLTQGMLVAERLRELISSHKFEGIGMITASFGVAEYRAGESVEELVARADEVLYVAKSRGKNCVVGATCGSRAVLG